MTQLNHTYNADDLPTGDDFKPIPPGWYRAHIVDADLCDTRAQTGQYIKLRFDIVGPQHQGRVVFANINIRNPNTQAEEIGRKQLGQIMRAIGVPQVDDTDQLIGGLLDIKVTIREASGQFDAQNDVRDFRAVEGDMHGAAPAPSTAAPQAQQPAAAKNAPPWAKQ